MFVVEKRDAKTLMPIILRNVKKGSQINSDEWRAYSRLNKHNYNHFTVNHSKNFVDPVTKQHTQLIECLWLVAKSTIMKRRRGTCTKNLPGHLAEDWLRSLDKNYPNVFIKILSLLKSFSNSEVVEKCKILKSKHEKETRNFKII
jgi:predicted ABC-class ATPase